MENNKIYFTLVGEHLFYGPSILEKGMELTLVKIENNTCAIIEYVLSYGAICSLKGEVVNG